VAALEEQQRAEVDRAREAARATTDVQRAWKAEAFLSSAVTRLQVELCSAGLSPELDS
jgi:hypothetical protein